MMPTVRRLFTAAVLVAGIGCTELANSDEQLPAHTQRYVFFPLHLRYIYMDSTPGREERYDWIGDTTFLGYTCIQMIPTTVGDSVGDFRLKVSGENYGVMQRTLPSGVDSVYAYFLPPVSLGTGGSYVRNSSGALTLNWANGTRSRYFDLAAVLGFDSGDTLRSDVVLNFTNGFVEWHVSWAPSGFC